MSDLIIEKFINNNSEENFKVTRGNKTVTFHSLYPYEEARRITSMFNTNLQWILICGIGMGYIAAYLLDNTKCNLIIYEHSNEIIETVKNDKLSDILSNPRINIFTGDFQNVIDFLTNNRINELSFYIHRPYYQLFPEFYSSVEGILIAYLSKKQINKTTLKRFQKVWLRNIIKNFKYYFNLPGIKDIRHNLKGKPAVIVGAGPSLAKNINLLKEIQDNVIIISTDTALTMLQNFHIKADFVVSVDPQDKNSLYLLYSAKNESFLVIDAAASFLSYLKYPQDKLIIFDTIFPLYESFKDFWGPKGKLLSGGSVSTTAFDFARFLGSDPIIFIGQDLAFSGKQTHFNGSILEEFFYYKINRINTYESYNARSLVMSDKIEVDGYNGDHVLTDRKFVTFLEWFLAEFRFTKAKVINSTEGGVYFKGIDHIPLKDAALKMGLFKTINKNIEIDPVNIDMSGFIKALKDISEKINELVPLSRKALIASDLTLAQYCTNGRKGGKSLNFEPMTSFDMELLRDIKEKSYIAKFIELTMQNSIDQIMDAADKPETEVNEELLKKWNQFYREAYTGLVNIKRLLKKTGI